MRTPQHDATTGTAVDFALGLLEDQGNGRVEDPMGRLPEVSTAVSGLEVRSRVSEVVITDGDMVAVRVRTNAVTSSSGSALSWPETHIVQVSGPEVVRVWSEFPSHRIAAQAAGDALRWPAPPDLVSTRVAATGVKNLARFGGAGGPDPAAVVDRYVQEFKNAQRFSVFPRLFAPDFRHHFDFPGRSDGFESFLSVGRELLSAFMSVTVKVEALLNEGDLVVERNHVSAVQRRPFAGVAPTGRPVAWTEIHLYRVRRGRIVENWPGVDVERLVASL